MKSVRPVALTPALSHRERETGGAACCPHPNPLPQGEGDGRCGMLPSPRPSPTGRGGQTVRPVALTPALSHRERETDDAACCPHPSPLPVGEGDRRCGLLPSPQPSPTGRGRQTVRPVALTPALSHRERGTGCPLTLSHRERCTSAHGAPDEVALMEGGATR